MPTKRAKPPTVRLRRLFKDAPIDLALLNACWSATSRVQSLCEQLIQDGAVRTAIGHGKPVADHSGARRPALHAASLGFHHPATRKWQTWTSALPEDLQDLLRRLRQAKARN